MTISDWAILIGCYLGLRLCEWVVKAAWAESSQQEVQGQIDYAFDKIKPYLKPQEITPAEAAAVLRSQKGKRHA